jgi:predicted secreted Zn-dependent protease
MKNALSNRALLLALAWALPTSVLAKDTSTVTLYPVTGSSAQLVYDDIKAHAPRVAANATFAFTMIATKTDKREKPSAKACGYDKFKTSAIFNFVLPKHKSPEQLSKKTRIAWADFVFYLKTHEEVIVRCGKAVFKTMTHKPWHWTQKPAPLSTRPAKNFSQQSKSHV